LHSSEERAGEFVVTCRNGTELFELIEETFDEVSFAVKREIRFSGFDPIRFGRDDGCDSTVVEDID
jgi:hypothetical protein